MASTAFMTLICSDAFECFEPSKKSKIDSNTVLTCKGPQRLGALPNPFGFAFLVSLNPPPTQRFVSSMSTVTLWIKGICNIHQKWMSMVGVALEMHFF